MCSLQITSENLLHAERSDSLRSVADWIVEQIISTAVDLAEVFRTGDPLTAIDKRLADIKAAQVTLADEQKRWEQLREAVERFAVQADPGRNVSPSKDTVSRPGRVRRVRPPVRRRVRVPRPSLNARQEAALKLMREAPGREWRLRELVAELTGRGWLDETDWLDNQLAKDLPVLVGRGLLERPMKGVYRLPPETVAAEPGGERGSDPEDGSQNGSGSAVVSSDLFELAGPAPGSGPGSSG